MEQFKNPLAQANAMEKAKPAHVNLYGSRFGNVDIMFGGEPHTVVRNKGYNKEFDEDDLIIRDKAGNLKHVGSSQIYWENPMKPKELEQSKGNPYDPEKLSDEGLSQEELDKALSFKPTKETIWNDPKHALYGISPSEQNEKFLTDAIAEIERNTQSPAHFKFYAGGSGGTMGDAQKQLARYKKALEYIRSFGGK